MVRKRTSGKSNVQTITRAVAILRTLGESEGAIGVTAISEKLGLHKSTVSRLLGSLQQEGFVQQLPENGKYRLGLGLISLANTALERIDFRHIAHPHLEALAEQTQETVNVALLDQEEVVNIDRVSSPQSIRHAGWIGRRTPTHCTSTGKVLLAFLPEQELSQLPNKLTRCTERTITDRATLLATLAEVRRQGYATSEEEFEEGLSAVAAPLRDRSGTVVAAISISGPSYRITPEQIQKFVEPLLHTAEEISAQLGNIEP